MTRSHPETPLIRENADFVTNARREDEGVPVRYVEDEQRSRLPKAAFAGAEGLLDGF
jgi:hypothetical protein